MKHIRNYGKARRALIDWGAHELERAGRDYEALKEAYGNPECLDKSCGAYRLKRDTTWCAAGRVVTEDDVARMERIVNKEIPADIRRWSARLDAADGAGRLLEINVRVSWRKSRTWGSNPHAEAYVCYETPGGSLDSALGEGRASGCGYDKRSAAVQEAFGFAVKRGDGAVVKASKAAARAALDRFVVEHGEELWKQYAVDAHPVPHFCFDGKGMSTFTSLFKRIGCRDYGACVNDYVIDYNESAADADVYHVIRKDRLCL